jgi:hypothetical protein
MAPQRFGKSDRQGRITGVKKKEFFYGLIKTSAILGRVRASRCRATAKNY